MKKAIIIGAGFTGCMFAMMLRKKGWSVEVFDMSSLTGGGVRTFYHGGHPYTYGPRHFIGPETNMKAFEFLNKIITTERFNPKGNYGFDKETWENLNDKSKNEYRGYQIACAQLCGNSHYKMRGFVTIDTETEYNAWLAIQAEYLEEEGDDEDW